MRSRCVLVLHRLTLILLWSVSVLHKLRFYLQGPFQMGWGPGGWGPRGWGPGAASILQDFQSECVCVFYFCLWFEVEILRLFISCVPLTSMCEQEVTCARALGSCTRRALVHVGRSGMCQQHLPSSAFLSDSRRSTAALNRVWITGDAQGL